MNNGVLDKIEETPAHFPLIPLRTFGHYAGGT